MSEEMLQNKIANIEKWQWQFNTRQLFSYAGILIAVIIWALKYDSGVVKQEDYIKSVKVIENLSKQITQNRIIDSTNNVNTNGRINDLKKTVEDFRFPTYTSVTQRRLRNGEIQYIPVN